MNTERVAFDLLARLHAIAGPVIVQQADLVLTEDHQSVMCYLYTGPLSSDCTALCIDLQPGFDAAALRAALESPTQTRH